MHPTPPLNPPLVWNLYPNIRANLLFVEQSTTDESPLKYAIMIFSHYCMFYQGFKNMKSSEINGSALVPIMYIQFLLMQLHVWHQTGLYLPVLWSIDPQSCAPKEHVAYSDFWREIHRLHKFSSSSSAHSTQFHLATPSSVVRKFWCFDKCF